MKKSPPYIQLKFKSASKSHQGEGTELCLERYLCLWPRRALSWWGSGCSRAPGGAGTIGGHCPGVLLSAGLC